MAYMRRSPNYRRPNSYAHRNNDGVVRVCSTCRFWDRNKHECRISAPKVFVVPADKDVDQCVTMWPSCGEDDWCGQWTYGIVQFSDAAKNTHSSREEEPVAEEE